MMNIPQISSVEVAVRLYYERLSLFTKDIKELFPGISSCTVQQLKKCARDKADEMGKMQYNNRSVLTECAYLAWGLDIDSLERRLNKIRKYQKTV